MRTGFSIAVLAAAILLLLQIVPAALAQDYDRDDPPTRAGRIGFIEGSVSFQPGGEGDWVQAVPNRPLTVGDNLWVDRDSRAEVQIGSTSIRLGPETSLTFLDLGNNVTQLRLSMGSLFFRVRHYGGDDAFEVDTPNLAFNVNRPGQFRVSVNQNGDQTLASVFRGEAEVTGGGNSYRLVDGQRGTFSGVDQLSYDVDEIGSRDSFDQWALSRDEREDRNRSSHYISTEMTGYEDLDDYGRWHEVAGYGNVWSPGGVPGDWAPYRYGHWVFVSPWGWTWVEDEPWGFAPFHYGRWAFVESSWCWVPGPVAVAPVYAPALVAFVGGGGFSIGVGVGGGGGVGWFPLGPGEVFVPWYRTSPRYVQTVNVTNTRVNVTQVTNVYNNVTVNHVNNVTYVNQRVTNSVTVVNHDTFVNARPVHQNIMRVDARQIASAPVTHEVVRNIQPARESMVGPARPMQARPPEQAISRQVVATREPVRVNRPEAAPGMERRAAPPPVRTVRAAPPTEAQPLQRGARGNSGGPRNNEAAPRPGAPENRPGAGNNREAAPRPGAPENNREAAPRPGAPENRPAQPESNRPGAGNNREAAPRPGAPENNREAAPRPGAPENNRPGAENNRPENNRNVAPRPGAPENNREAAPRPSAPENRPAQPESNRPAQQVPRPPSANRPEAAPEQPRGNPSARPENTRPENTRPEETPRTRQEPPSRAPETRQQSAPPQNQSRPEAAPRQNETRPQPSNRPETRNEPVPRPETRPSEPPSKREARPQGQQNEKNNPPPSNEEKKNKDKNKENEPPKYR